MHLGFAAMSVGVVLASPISNEPSEARVAVARAPTITAVNRVWSGHSVGFALVVTKAAILAAYYDADRHLTVASRPRRGGDWVYRKLDSRIGWDSHNYIAMAVDASGQIHVAGNMHNDPLIYYRTQVAGDVRTLIRQPIMVKAKVERRMTYPVFLHDGSGRLIFKYRDGGSGNGNEIYNVYDQADGRWRPLLATPLTDGEGRRNAYFVGPVLGPDRLFHLAWVWRESPMAESNHDLSYARSRDLVHWERSDGTPLMLPITSASAEIVDPVPVGGGMINNNTVVGFDPDGRVMITYHKFDAAGRTQIYVARREKPGWRSVQVSEWQGFRWDFRGGGSLDSRLFVAGAVPVGRDQIRLSVVRDGKPLDFLLDARSLRRISENPGRRLAGLIGRRVSVPAGMMLNTVEDAGGTGIALAWATRPPNRDLPSKDIPDPTVLHVIEPAR